MVGNQNINTCHCTFYRTVFQTKSRLRFDAKYFTHPIGLHVILGVRHTIGLVRQNTHYQLFACG